MSRRHRWIRGDWQIAAWLGWFVPSGQGGRVRNSISLLSRWKILDNLRRSLVPIALLVLLIASWWIPGAALRGTAAVLAILLLPGLMAAAAELARRPREIAPGRHLGEIARTLGRQVVRELFGLVCLPYEAYVSASAIARTLVRLLVTKRRLLEWRTARDAQRARSALAGTYAAMWIAPGMALAVVLALAAGGRGLWPAVGIAPLWALAPGLAWWMSLSRAASRPTLEPDDRRLLRVLARRTWRFFETFVGPEDNHLPPDNFQEDPPRGAAHRTSPTNIGLALASNLAAYDFGYLSAGEVVERTGLTLAAMDKLQRFRGHFYNWYDTQTLTPLLPTYISTVDSGNLAGHLIVLGVGLSQMVDAPILRPETFDGIADTLEVTNELLASRATQGAAAAEVAGLRARLSTPARTLSAARGLLEALVDDCTRLDEVVRKDGDVDPRARVVAGGAGPTVPERARRPGSDRPMGRAPGRSTRQPRAADRQAR